MLTTLQFPRRPRVWTGSPPYTDEYPVHQVAPWHVDAISTAYRLLSRPPPVAALGRHRVGINASDRGAGDAFAATRVDQLARLHETPVARRVQGLARDQGGTGERIRGSAATRAARQIAYE